MPNGHNIREIKGDYINWNINSFGAQTDKVKTAELKLDINCDHINLYIFEYRVNRREDIQHHQMF